MPSRDINKENPLLPTIRYLRTRATAKTFKVTLVRPPDVMPRFSFAPQRTQPLGLAYLAAALRSAGHRVQMVDGVGENTTRLMSYEYDDNLLLGGLTYDEIVAHIDRDADIIGISCMFSVDWPKVKRLIRKIHAAFPAIPIIGGGEHFSALPEYSLRDCPEVMACVIGEGEETLLELLEALGAGKDLNAVEGIAYHQQDKVLLKYRRGRIANIDDIAPPAWDLVPMENYFTEGIGHGINRGRTISMLATRGCPFQCTFCSSAMMWTTRWIARDPERVLDEIEDYVKRYKIDNVDFLDLTAIIRKDWIISFAKGLLRRNIKITWQLPVGTRSEAIDREVARYLYESGCRNMGFSPESGSPVTLDQIKKRVHLGHIKTSMRDCIKAGLNVKFNIIIGFPEETHKEVWKSLRFLLKMSFYGAHDASLFPFAPYPGSELFDDLKKEGLIVEPLDDAFFDSLCYVDFTRMRTFAKHIDKSWIRFYQLFGFALFYGSNYLFRPWRVVMTIWHVATGRFESRGETVLHTMIKRAFSKAKKQRDVERQQGTPADVA